MNSFGFGEQYEKNESQKCKMQIRIENGQKPISRVG